MTPQQELERLIAERYHQFPWYGGITIEEAIRGSIRYRQGLSEADRQLFDEQIMLGRHPIKALETVEIVSGRDKPHGSEREEAVLSVRK